MQYYDLLGLLAGSLNAESMCLGTSLLSGRIGEKVFADHFSLAHDVSEQECWNTPFFDGEGVVQKGDRLPYIENGVVLRGSRAKGRPPDTEWSIREAPGERIPISPTTGM